MRRLEFNINSITESAECEINNKLGHPCMQMLWAQQNPKHSEKI